MPRPRGCTCGTPKPCKVHPPAEGENPGGRAQDAPLLSEPAAASILRAIEDAPQSAGRAEQAADAIEQGEGRAARRRRDPAPKPRKRARAKVVAPDAPDDTALIDMLAQLLTMPAIPAGLILNCEFCRDHFINEGPKAARELVALSITNPALRGALESLHSGFTKLTIAGVLAGYLAKPLIHHVAPEPVLYMAGPAIGVPPRPEKPAPDHDHDHDHAPSPPPPAPAEYAREPAPDFGASAPDQYPGDQAAGIAAA